MNALTLSPWKAEALAPEIARVSVKDSLALPDLISASSGLGVRSVANDLPLERTSEGSDTAGPSLRLPVDQSYFELVNQWEGRITEVRGGVVYAVMRELSDLAQPDEDAEFPVDEVEPSDQQNLVPGAVFYFNVGYSVSRVGVKRRNAYLKIRKLLPRDAVSHRATALPASFFTNG